MPNDKIALDWSEPILRAQRAIKAAWDALALNDHVEGRKQLWIARRALNEAENASLDMCPPDEPIK